MTYRVAGLDPAEFAPLWAMDDDELSRRPARRVAEETGRGFPRRVALEDAPCDAGAARCFAARILRQAQDERISDPKRSPGPLALSLPKGGRIERDGQ